MSSQSDILINEILQSAKECKIVHGDIERIDGPTAIILLREMSDFIKVQCNRLDEIEHRISSLSK